MNPVDATITPAELQAELSFSEKEVDCSNEVHANTVYTIELYIKCYICWRVGGTPRAGAPCSVVPPCGPPAVLCAPLWWARAPCAASPAVGSCPVCWCPPAVLWPRPRPLL